MKKLVLLALAAFLLVAFSAEVYAATTVTHSGNYRVRYHARDNRLLLGGQDNESQDNRWDHRFRERLTIKPNDNITMFAWFEAINTNWGADVNNTDGVGAATPTGSNGYYANETSGSLYVQYAYFDVKSAYGTFSIGRQSTNVEGLAMMGYLSNNRMFDWQADNIFDAERPNDRFKWVYKTGPLTAGFAFTKVLELDSQQGSTVPPLAKDGDVTDYEAFVDYRFANGGFWFSYIYEKDGSQVLPGGYGTLSTVWDTPGTRHAITRHTLQPAAFMSFGPFKIAAEIEWLTGQVESVRNQAIDLRGFGAFVEAQYNFGPGAVGLQYVYTKGDDNPFDNKLDNQVATGGDYFPFVVANLAGGVAQGRRTGTMQGTHNVANLTLISASGTYNVSESLMLGAAFGYFKVNELTPAQQALNYDKDLGYEFDLRLQYKIMPNLTYYAHAGYFWAGDYHKQGTTNIQIGDAWAVSQNITLTW